jgi:hypothetical protein
MDHPSLEATAVPESLKRWFNKPPAWNVAAATKWRASASARLPECGGAA